jgi:hypothetical protein
MLLVLALVFCFGTTAFAANSTTATVPVTLTVANEYRSVNVTVPASLPVYVINGTVVTADNAKITNNSKTGSIQVTGIRITDGAYKVGSYDSFSGSKTIALKINDCVTIGAGEMSITSSAFPVISAGSSQALIYYTKVSSDAPNADNVQAANIVFTISIVD